MMVWCDDKIHNLQSLLQAYKLYGNDIRSKFNTSLDEKLWFYGEVMKILKKRSNNEIVQEFERVFKEVVKYIEKNGKEL